MCRCHGGTKGRGNSDVGVDWFNAGEALRASSARAGGAGVEDHFVRDME